MTDLEKQLYILKPEVVNQIEKHISESLMYARKLDGINGEKIDPTILSKAGQLIKTLKTVGQNNA